jgi:Flp pilus assembly pilin Flp
MKLLKTFTKFCKDESGAVTVDWVVLTAAVVGLGLLIANTMGSAIDSAATTIGAEITANAQN